MAAQKIRTKVLLVDDEALPRRAVARVLRARLGVCVEQRPGGREALAALEDDSFAVAIIDLDMPGMDGMELLRRLRQRLPTLPVIVWSARDVTLESEGLSRATAVVSKMAGTDRLLAAIGEYLPAGELQSGTHLRAGRLQTHLAEQSRRVVGLDTAGTRGHPADRLTPVPDESE
ncbi:MAG: response regulator [Sandaracinaceae bacterium]